MSDVEGKEIKELLPECKVLSLQLDHHQSIADRYERHALSCFDYIRNILSNKPQGKIQIQIVIGNDKEQVIFTGLSGLLKTATLENPILTGQIILTDSEINAGALFLQLQENEKRFQDQVVKYDQDIRYVL
ncbi:hypothetical protein, partial [Aquimarina macrocephali]|uniref:hypothetical protein n=1 Tax=Aquimarina macrocephali TaxID=666563 RepID=UPI000552EE7A